MERGCIVVDGRAGPTHLGISWPLTMNDAGDVIAVRARVKGGQVLLVNDRVIGPFDYVSYPRIGPDGRSVGVIIDWDSILVNDERTEVADGEVNSFAIGWDGRLAAYAWTSEDEKHFIRQKDRTWEVPAQVKDMAVTRGGKLYYVHSDSKAKRATLMLDGRLVAEHESIVRLEIAPDDTPIYDAGGLVVHGRTYPAVQDLHYRRRIAFSPDMKKLAYGALIGRELWWKVIALE